MGKIGKSAGSVSIIGGSDGPTSVFLVGGGKKTLKQKFKKHLFELRKKWYARRIKPEAHTMAEVVAYAKERYGFTELPGDAKEYLEQYKDMRTSLIIQHAPKLLGEYVAHPVLASHDEEGVREFQRQMEVRQKKAMEISEEEFPIEFYVLKKLEGKREMHLYLEGRFGYIGGGFSGPGRSEHGKFRKLYKDIYRYYGVTKEDIINKTGRYKELLTTLAAKH